jgi:hypothetical protein
MGIDIHPGKRKPFFTGGPNPGDKEIGYVDNFKDSGEQHEPQNPTFAGPDVNISAAPCPGFFFEIDPEREFSLKQILFKTKAWQNVFHQQSITRGRGKFKELISGFIGIP